MRRQAVSVGEIKRLPSRLGRRFISPTLTACRRIRIADGVGSNHVDPLCSTTVPRGCLPEAGRCKDPLGPERSFAPWSAFLRSTQRPMTRSPGCPSSSEMGRPRRQRTHGVVRPRAQHRTVIAQTRSQASTRWNGSFSLGLRAPSRYFFFTSARTVAESSTGVTPSRATIAC